ncbi:MAG: recombinase family protein [Clostridia bacterium]|nr:recombinase family protein [Clostridia bacterium]
MKTAVIYARYSSERRTEKSIEGQIRECMSYAEHHDIIIVDTYIDRAMTGKNDNRTDFQRMLKDAQKGAWDMVLVYKLDRFSRNKYEMAIHKKTLKDHGIMLVSAKEHIPEGPEGIILESLLEGMAEYYSVELAQKVSRGQRESRIKGNYAGGGIPYGYRVENKRFFVNEDEAAIVINIFEMYAAGTYAKNIIKALTEKGIMHRKGKPFTQAIIYGILQNTRYVGVYNHKSEGEYTNMFPPIVPQHLFDHVQAIVEGNRHGRHPKENIMYLLKNKLRCGYCHKPITSDSGTSKTGKVIRYYKCGLKKKDTTLCHKAAIRKEVLEQLVVDTTVTVLDNPETIDFITARIFEAHEQKLKETSVLNLLEAERNKLRKALDNMLDAVAQGIITSSTKQRIEEIEAALVIAEGKVLAEKAKSQVQITPADIKRFICKALKKEPYSMIRLLVKEIILYDDKVEIYYNFIDKKRPGDLDHQAFCIYSEDCDIDPKDFGLNYNAKSAKLRLELYF